MKLAFKRALTACLFLIPWAGCAKGTDVEGDSSGRGRGGPLNLDAGTDSATASGGTGGVVGTGGVAGTGAFPATGGAGAIPGTGGTGGSGAGGSSGTGGSDMGTGGDMTDGGASMSVFGQCSDPDFKRCGGLCVPPGPGNGCMEDTCDACPMVENATLNCEGDPCGYECDQGYVDSGTGCEPVSGCDDNMMNGNETDVDCGGDTCAPCETDQGCLEDSDCAQGPCESEVCTCVPLTCDEVMGCGSTVDDGCGGTIDCSDSCPTGDVCVQDTCCTPNPASVDDCGADQCGMVDDGCGGTVDCGDPCMDPAFCHDGSCCTPSDCSAPDTCGFEDDGCGGNACTPCGSGECCSEDRECASGNCQAGFGFNCGFLVTSACE